MFFYLTCHQSIIALITLGLFFAFSFLKPRLSFYAIIFALPLYIIEVGISMVHFNLLEGLIDLLFLSVFLNVKHWNAVKAVYIRYGRFLLLLSFFFILILLGIFLNKVNILRDLAQFKVIFLDPILLFLSGLVLFRKEDAKNMLNVFFAGGFLLSILALLFKILVQIHYGARFQFFYDSPNYLAMYFVPILGAGLFLLWKNKNRSAALNVYCIFGIILVSCLLILANSYSSFISIFFGIAVVAAFRFKNMPRKEKTAIIILFFLAILSICVSFRVKLFNAGHYPSLSPREYIWEKSMQICQNRYIVGIGVGNFQKGINSYLPPRLYDKVPHPNNLYLMLLTETGFVGLMLFIVIVLYILKNVRKIKDASVQNILIFYFSSFLAWGFFDTVYFKNDLAAVFWIMAAISGLL